MFKVAQFHGYDIFELSKKECRENLREWPCVCVFPDDWNEAEDEDGPREVDFSESEFTTITEAEKWCKEYRRK